MRYVPGKDIKEDPKTDQSFLHLKKFLADHKAICADKPKRTQNDYKWPCKVIAVKEPESRLNEIAGLYDKLMVLENIFPEHSSPIVAKIHSNLITTKTGGFTDSLLNYLNRFYSKYTSLRLVGPDH